MATEPRVGLNPAVNIGPQTKVSSGLNLWLKLKEPATMGALIGTLLEEQEAIDAALNGLHYVHFARFLPTRGGDALQVITSFDGSFDAYVLDFVLAIGSQFDLILGHIEDAPRLPVRDHPAEFLEFVRKNDLGRGDSGEGLGLYSAYPGHTVIDILGATGFGPAAAEPAEVTVDRADVQANVLRGLRARHALYIAWRFTSGDGAAALLSEMLTGDNGCPMIANDADWSDAAGRPDCAVTMGLTYSGLKLLGIDEADRNVFETLHPDFFNGPDDVEVAQEHGDTGPSDPAFWVLGGSHRADMVVTLLADADEALNDAAARLQARAQAHGMNLVLPPWRANELVGDDGLLRVHFGYVDGIAQPRLAIQGGPAGEPDRQPRAGVGEFLLGRNYPNVFGGANSLGELSPALADNATFAALRIMEQDVVAFEALLDKASQQHKADREWLAAKLMGRWRDGTPLSLAPLAPVSDDPAAPRNDFDYLPRANRLDSADDAAGLRCPVGAHVRRVNPRSARVAGRPQSRRLIRRGMPYGPAYDPARGDDGQPRGLVGVFICADLARQFAFILREWTQGDQATHGIRGQQDPITGAQTDLRDGHPVNGQYRIPMPGGRPDIVIDMPRLVKTVGSVYLFMPGMGGVRHLAKKHRHGTERDALSGRLVRTFASQLLRLELPRDAALLAAAPPTPDPNTFDPREADHRADPFPTYAWFRANMPMVKLKVLGSTWVFSDRHVAAIAGDPKLFRKADPAHLSTAGLLNMDPPAHTSCRAEMAPMFAKVLAAVAPTFQALVERQYTIACQGRGKTQPLDWLAAFAKPVARSVFFAHFGLPLALTNDTVKNVEASLALKSLDNDPAVEQRVRKKLIATATDLFKVKSKAAPGGMFNEILAMKTLHDCASNQPIFPLQSLDVEHFANAATMALAGILPLQWFIALATWRLLQDNGRLLKILKANPGITERAVVDELLRFDTSTPLSDRYVAEDTEVDGFTFATGDRLTLVWASANRDENAFGPKAGEIDFARKKGPGWAFGAAGERQCLGLDLIYAVMEPVVSVLRIADPEPTLAQGFEPAWGQGDMFRPMAALMVHC